MIIVNSTRRFLLSCISAPASMYQCSTPDGQRFAIILSLECRLLTMQLLVKFKRYMFFHSSVIGEQHDHSASIYGAPNAAQRQPRKHHDPESERSFPVKDLLDLDGIFDSVVQPEKHIVNQMATSTAGCSKAADVDLLTDIFTTKTPIAPISGDPALIIDNAVMTEEKTLPSQSQRASTQVKAFEKDGLTIIMDLVDDPLDTKTSVICKFFNYTHNNFERFVFQAAVPKYVNMEMKPATAGSVSANSRGDVSQIVKVRNVS